jgi:hypothetical protein
VAAECEIDACGVLAVGRCQICGRAFCSSHRHTDDSRLFGNPTANVVPTNFCVQCWKQAADDARARQEREQKAQHDVATTEWARREAKAQQVLARVPDRTERLLIAFRYWTREVPDYAGAVRGRRRRPSTTSVPHVSLFSDAFPELWPLPVHVDLDADVPRWDSAGIAQWFADRARASGISAPAAPGWHSGGLFGRQLKGWVVPTTKVLRSANGESVTYEGCYIDKSGQLSTRGAHIRPEGLSNLATMLRLADPGIVLDVTPTGATWPG